MIRAPLPALLFTSGTRAEGKARSQMGAESLGRRLELANLRLRFRRRRLSPWHLFPLDGQAGYSHRLFLLSRKFRVGSEKLRGAGLLQLEFNHPGSHQSLVLLGLQRRRGRHALLPSLVVIRGGIADGSQFVGSGVFTPRADSHFSAGAAVILDATAVGNYMNFLVPAVSARTYDVRVGVKTTTTRGIVQLAIGPAGNNSPTNVSTPRDLYSATDQYVELDLGAWTPSTTSDKWFWFTMIGKNASSTGLHWLRIDYIFAVAPVTLINRRRMVKVS